MCVTLANHTHTWCMTRLKCNVKWCKKIPKVPTLDSQLKMLWLRFEYIPRYSPLINCVKKTCNVQPKNNQKSKQLTLTGRKKHDQRGVSTRRTHLKDVLHPDRWPTKPYKQGVNQIDTQHYYNVNLLPKTLNLSSCLKISLFFRRNNTIISLLENVFRPAES